MHLLTCYPVGKTNTSLITVLKNICQFYFVTDFMQFNECMFTPQKNMENCNVASKMLLRIAVVLKEASNSQQNQKERGHCVSNFTCCRGVKAHELPPLCVCSFSIPPALQQSPRQPAGPM